MIVDQNKRKETNDATYVGPTIMGRFLHNLGHSKINAFGSMTQRL